MLLDTDRLNVLEMARATYARRISEHVPRAASRAEALAYLRRKTHWSGPYAAGAFDAYLTLEGSIHGTGAITGG